MRQKIMEILKNHIAPEELHSVAEEINLAIFDHFIPVLDLAEDRIRKGSTIELNYKKEIRFYDRDGETIASGETLRKMLLNFLWLETSDGSDNE